MKDKEINNFIRETGKMGDIWTKEQVKDDIPECFIGGGAGRPSEII